MLYEVITGGAGGPLPGDGEQLPGGRRGWPPRARRGHGAPRWPGGRGRPGGLAEGPSYNFV